MQKLRIPLWTDFLLLVLLGAMFGSSFVLMKIAVDTIPTFYVVFFRILVAFLILFGFMKIKQYKVPPLSEKKFWNIIIFLGFTSNIVPFALITWAEKTINSNLAAVYMATIPIFSLLLAHIFTEDEKINQKKIAGCCIAFIGVVFLLWQDVGNISINLFAQIACVLAAISYASSRIISKQIGAINPVVISVCVLGSGIISMLPFVFFFSHLEIDTSSSKSFFAVLLLGIFPTALAFVILYKLIRDVGAVFMTGVNYLVPPFALFWGFVILNESISFKLILSLCVIFLGLFVISSRGTNNQNPR